MSGTVSRRAIMSQLRKAQDENRINRARLEELKGFRRGIKWFGDLNTGGEHLNLSHKQSVADGLEIAVKIMQGEEPTLE